MKRFLDPIPYILVTAAFVAVVALAITYKPPVHKVDIVSAGTVVRVTAMPGAFNAPDVTQLETDKYILILRGYHSARVGQNVWLHNDLTDGSVCVSLDSNPNCFDVFK